MDFKKAYKLIIREGKGRLILTILLTSAQWFCRFSVLTALIMGLGIKVDVLELFLLQWVIFVTMIFIPTPGATGGAEVTFVYLFGHIIPKEMIAVAMAGWRFLSYYFIMLLAVILIYAINSLKC